MSDLGDDWSWQKGALLERIHMTADAWTLPSVLYRPRLIQDGNGWICLYGENIAEGVVGTGSTPAEAVNDFDYFAWWGKTDPKRVAIDAALASARQANKGETRKIRLKTDAEAKVHD